MLIQEARVIYSRAVENYRKITCNFGNNKAY
jgi:hypothetical protein